MASIDEILRLLEEAAKEHVHDGDGECAACGGVTMKSFIEQTRAKVEEYGHIIQAVVSDEGPGWSYTVGLRNFGFPEIVVFGMPPRVAQSLLNHVVQTWKDNGSPVEVDGGPVEKIANKPLHFRTLPKTDLVDEHLRQAQNYYQDYSHIDAVQMVWCDEDDLFPWDRGCKPHYAEWQSKLMDWRPAPGGAKLN